MKLKKNCNVKNTFFSSNPLFVQLMHTQIILKTIKQFKAFKNYNICSNMFWFTSAIIRELISCVVLKLQCWFQMYMWLMKFSVLWLYILFRPGVRVHCALSRIKLISFSTVHDVHAHWDWIKHAATAPKTSLTTCTSEINIVTLAKHSLLAPW